jgi:surface polysaccharide O-acyltransferase-like enzyme
VGQRLAWIEASRTLACVLVVLVHVNIHIRAGMETWWPGGFAGAPILALSVPVFFIIAGFIADLGSSSQREAGSALPSRLRRLLIPFLTWNAITLLALSLNAGFVEGSAVLQLLTGTWHLYFIFALVQLLVLHALIQPLLSSQLTKVVVAGVLATVIAYAVSEAVVWVIQPGDGSFEVHGKKPFIVWTGFFLVGVWWHRHGIRLTGTRVPVFLMAAGAAYVLYVADLQMENARFGFTPRKQLLLGGLPFQLLGAIGVLACLRWWDQSGRCRRLLLALGRPGRDTFGIYLSHIAVLVLLWRIWDAMGKVSMSWIEVPLFTVATWVVSRVLVRTTRSIGTPLLIQLSLGERAARAQSVRAGSRIEPAEPQAARGG